jgi:hypothetical protein
LCGSFARDLVSVRVHEREIRGHVDEREIRGHVHQREI